MSVLAAAVVAVAGSGKGRSWTEEIHPKIHINLLEAAAPAEDSHHDGATANHLMPKTTTRSRSDASGRRRYFKS